MKSRNKAHQRGAAWSTFHAKQCLGYHIKKNAISRARGMCGRKNHLQDPGVDGRIILKWILREKDGVVDWIFLVQDRDKWQAPDDTVMNLWIPKMRGIYWLAEELPASQEGPCSMVWVG